MNLPSGCIFFLNEVCRGDYNGCLANYLSRSVYKELIPTKCDDSGMEMSALMYVFLSFVAMLKAGVSIIKETYKYKVRYNADFARDELRCFIICLNIFSSLLFETKRQLLYIGITDR